MAPTSLFKVDHQWSDKNRFFGEWLFNPGKYNNYRIPWTGATFPAGSFGYGGQLPFDFANQIIAGGNTYTLNPTLINEFRASFTRQYYNTNPKTGGYPNSVTDLSGAEAVLDPIQIPSASTIPSFSVNTPAAGAATGGGSESTATLNWGPIGWTNNMNAHESYTILDNLTKIIGKHTLRTGFVYRLSHSAMYQSGPTPLMFYGFANPSTGLSGGSGLAQFEMGAVPDNGNAYADISWVPYARYRYWGAYLQDDFRITPSLTLNLGLRYDINGSYKTRQHPDSRFCLTCTDPLTGLPGFIQYEGDPGFPMNSDVRAPNFNDLGPRINFAWNPFSGRKTVIRGGYDLYYSNAYSAINSGQALENTSGYTYRAEWFGSTSSDCAAFSGQCVAWSLDDTNPKGPLATPPASTGFPADSHSPLYQAGINSMQKPTTDPMVQNWTLQVQRQLPGNTLLTVGYVGSHGTHLSGDLWFTATQISTANKLKYRNSINAIVPITDYFSGKAATGLEDIWGATSIQRSYLLTDYPQYAPGGISGTERFNGNSVYDALQVHLQKRYAHGLNFDIAYTWSKSIESADTGTLESTVIDPIHNSRAGWVGGRTGNLGNANTGFSYQQWDNIRGDRSLAFNDIPQNLNFFTTYELPFGASRKFVNRKGPLNLLIGGWNLTGNFNAEKGVPLNVSGPCDALTCRPDLVGNPSAVPGGRNQNQWINAAAFTPPYGSDQSFWQNPNINDDRWWQFGTAGLYLPGLRSPGYWNLDASLTKKFNVRESKYFEFRWEAFNALNHQNLGTPNTNYCLPPNPDGSTDTVHQAGCSFGRITNVQTDPRTLAFDLKFYW